MLKGEVKRNINNVDLFIFYFSDFSGIHFNLIFQLE